MKTWTETMGCFATYVTCVLQVMVTVEEMIGIMQERNACELKNIVTRCERGLKAHNRLSTSLDAHGHLPVDIYHHAESMSTILTDWAQTQELLAKNTSWVT